MIMEGKKEINTDILVIGGGINGTGIAVDAQLRGLNVVLCESNDLASATSSASSKLVHGGLRYLEQYEFKLVKEALKERDVLLKKAPHIIHPLEFILPHAKHLRSKFLIRIGLFLYDFLAGKSSLKRSKKISLMNTKVGSALIDEYKTGFSYSDCRIDDSRMVIFNAMQAKEHGAKILIPYRCVDAKRIDNKWQIKLINNINKQDTILVHAKAIVNAGGPWVANIIEEVIHKKSKYGIKLIKGSHFVIPKLYDGDHAYILQNKDGRIVFAIPYGFIAEDINEFTLIGTTDVNYKGSIRDIEINKEEIDYLCKLINNYFKHSINSKDIVWSYSGVRALYDDNSDNPSKITREYYLDLNDENGKLPILSVFGGKVTTYRTLSKNVVDKLKPYFYNMKNCITDTISTIGAGDEKSFKDILNNINNNYPWLDNKHSYRLASSYGMNTFNILNDAKSYNDLGMFFGYNLYEKEVNYLLNEEWVTNIDTLIWNRSKLGLWMSHKEINVLKEWLLKNKVHQKKY